MSDSTLKPPDEREQEQVDHEKAVDRQAPGARVVHEALLREGRQEIDRASMALAWSGLAAGISMGLSLVAEGALRHYLPDAEWRPLVASLGYSVGFLVVVLGHQQLYTENTLVAVLPFLHERNRANLVNAARLWAVVLVANMAGAFLFAWAAAATPAFSPGLRDVFREIGEDSMQYGPFAAFVKGIFGGWIIALMVWLLPGAEAARVWIIIVLSYVLAAAQFTHIIAGSVDAFFLIASGQISVGAYLAQYGGPVWLGNTLGGVVFVTLLNHAQVSAE